MRGTTVRAALFDFGGVVAEEGFRNGLQALAAQQGLEAGRLHEEGMRAVYDSGFVLGRGTAADFWAMLRQRTGLTGDDATLTETILRGFVPRPWMLELVSRLRARGLVTGILSDQTHWLDELDAQYHFSAVFDRVYNSFYLGKGKRDPSLFGEVAADLGMPPAAVLFIDDDATNVARARAAGLQAIHFVDRRVFTRELESVLSGD
jgi:putative hydrolase of the HAD superfamily